MAKKQRDSASVRRWLFSKTTSLVGKRVAVTGATGGLGMALCAYLADLEADLLLFARNRDKADSLVNALRKEKPALRIEVCLCDFEKKSDTIKALERLEVYRPDYLVLASGIYAVPRHHVCGVDNVFTVNCLSPYFLVHRLANQFKETGCHVVVVGSIAYRYKKSDPADFDFSGYRQSYLCYGNSKRTLMASLTRFGESHLPGQITVVHPGISFTGITAHYPKWLFALIKHPMKWIFMEPHKAALCLLAGLFTDCKPWQWIGPIFLDIWGMPKIKRFKGISSDEADALSKTMERVVAQWEQGDVLHETGVGC